ncbi:hypothetical protein RJ639_003127 [Escallonia herrerae]|uniref:Uncharacterized protein n=1 Tax=Escallonia herrerae TaxID=1293975 RepID=A0AA88W038_9ASTE|nr:hypothetical protein RJ639_003127 [Escallonia herrerae]
MELLGHIKEATPVQQFGNCSPIFANGDVSIMERKWDKTKVVLERERGEMTIKPTVALRAILVGGAAFAKIAGAVKAAGGAKMGAAAVAMTVAATAAVSGSKQEPKDTSKQS